MPEPNGIEVGHPYSLCNRHLLSQNRPYLYLDIDLEPEFSLSPVHFSCTFQLNAQRLSTFRSLQPKSSLLIVRGPCWSSSSAFSSVFGTSCCFDGCWAAQEDVSLTWRLVTSLSRLESKNIKRKVRRPFQVHSSLEKLRTMLRTKCISYSNKIIRKTFRYLQQTLSTI